MGTDSQGSDDGGPGGSVVAAVLQGWACELDACDGYLVLLDDPCGSDPLRALGPYTERGALEIADRVEDLLGASVHVVRFHSRHDQRP